ncbi:MAG: hypothetical protein OER86_00965 [Phycisphaerae bacterium]|nr:hypothetical protein [Phycisphaerae bacterium]
MKVSYWFGKALVGTRWLAVSVSLTVLCLGGYAFAETAAKSKAAATKAQPKVPATKTAKATDAKTKAKPARRAPVIDWSKTVKLPKPMKIGKVKSTKANPARDARFIGSAGQPLVLAGIAGAVAAGVGLSGSRSSTAGGGIPNACEPLAGTYLMSGVMVTGPNTDPATLAVVAHLISEFQGSPGVALNVNGNVSGGFLAGTWTCGQPGADTLNISALHSLVAIPPTVDFTFVPSAPVTLNSTDATVLGNPITFTASGTIGVIPLWDHDGNPLTDRVGRTEAIGTYTFTDMTFTRQ